MDHPFQDRRVGLRLRETLVRSSLRGATYAIVLIVALLIGKIFVEGIPVLFPGNGAGMNTGFLTKLPETLYVTETTDGVVHTTDMHGVDELKARVGAEAVRSEKLMPYTGGGILGPIVGTVLLTLVAMVIAMGLGVASAVYLSEYASQNRFIGAVRLAILNLAGVPSIVFGLFGLGLFVLAAPMLTETPAWNRALLAFPVWSGTYLSFQGWDVCVLSGAFTLAFVILPVVITASEECLRAVPQDFRNVSLALGATPWQTIRKSVLPYAMPGILTSSVLGVARVAGETAPIMFTAAVAGKDSLPWGSGGNWTNPLTESVQALPYHIYTISAKIPQNEFTRKAQYGAVLVFLMIVLSLVILSVALRKYLRNKYPW